MGNRQGHLAIIEMEPVLHTYGGNTCCYNNRQCLVTDDGIQTTAHGSMQLKVPSATTEEWQNTYHTPF
jgi:hypothetical protein